MKNKSIVSVLMAVYNGQDYLDESIMSILTQTFTDFEFLIINDGSSDNTKMIIENYAERDSRINYFENKKNIGLSATLNRGLKLCRGKYIARMDDDDVSMPSRLGKQVIYLERNPSVGLVSVGRSYMAPNGLIFETRMYPDNHEYIVSALKMGNNILDHGCVMFRKNLVSEMEQPYRFYYSQDLDLWLRLMETAKLGMIEESLHYRRRSSGSISWDLYNKRLKITKLILDLYIKRVSGVPEGNWKLCEHKILSEIVDSKITTNLNDDFYNGKAYFINKSFKMARRFLVCSLTQNFTNGIAWGYLCLSIMDRFGYLLWEKYNHFRKNKISKM